jgi:hypothetical protein
VELHHLDLGNQPDPLPSVESFPVFYPQQSLAMALAPIGDLVSISLRLH